MGDKTSEFVHVTTSIVSASSGKLQIDSTTFCGTSGRVPGGQNAIERRGNRVKLSRNVFVHGKQLIKVEATIDVHSIAFPWQF